MVLRAFILLILSTQVWADDADMLCSDFPPFVYFEKNKPKGMFIDIIDKLAPKAGVTPKIQFLPWKRAQEKVVTATREKPVCIFPLMRSKEREEKFKWVSLFYSDQASLTALKAPGYKWQKLEDARKYRIGVVRASPLLEQLSSKDFTSFDVVADVETNARKLKAGRIDAWFVPELVGRYTYKSAGFDVNEIETVYRVGKMDFYFACSKSISEDFVSKWQKAFSQIQKDGTYKKIVDSFH